MKNFEQSKSYKKLVKYAKKPIDLTKPRALTPERIDTMRANALGLTLFYATERVNAQVMQALIELVNETEALEKMQDMQSGKVINQIFGHKSEDRRVLHTAMRDFFSDRNLSKPSILTSQTAHEELDKLKKFLDKMEKDTHFSDIIQVGIGGSELGPRALYMASKRFAIHNRKAHFIANVDPDEIGQLLEEVDLSRSLVVVVSKSGSTLETKTNEEFLRRSFEKKGLVPKDHFISVTGEKSPMDNPKEYLASFYIWDYVGGRYSATSMVGAVTLSFVLGIGNFKELLEGASLMDKIALSKKLHENLPLLSACLGIWNRNFLHYPTCAIIPYSQALSRFPAHLQQLDMESNGKGIDKNGNRVCFDTGPIIWGEPGTNGQHSFYQLIHQGTTVVPVEFIGFIESQYQKDIEIENTTSQEKLLANLFAQAIALAKGQGSKNPNKVFLGNRPSRILLGNRLTLKMLGQLLAFYEHKVAFQGFIWDINSFDQEGVQLGKVLANKILDLFAKKRGKKTPVKFPLAEQYLKYLER